MLKTFVHFKVVFPFFSPTVVGKKKVRQSQWLSCRERRKPGKKSKNGPKKEKDAFFYEKQILKCTKTNTFIVFINVF